MRRTISAVIVLAFGMIAAGQASAAVCRNTGSFEKWLADFKKEALAQGISPSVLADASPYLQFEQRIINRDRAQGVFNQSFLKFSDRMIAGYRMQNGQQQMKNNAALFARVEKEFGVPAPSRAACWGLGRDVGKNTGNSNGFIAIATLAYDCRRPD
jgi:membrane-bound lytic murein transglycosylase B